MRSTTFICLGSVLLLLCYVPAQECTIGCFGLICSIYPVASQQCCKTMNRCCSHYQSWLYPLIGSKDTLSDFVRIMHSVTEKSKVDTLRTNETSVSNKGTDELLEALANLLTSAESKNKN